MTSRERKVRGRSDGGRKRRGEQIAPGRAAKRAAIADLACGFASHTLTGGFSGLGGCEATSHMQGGQDIPSGSKSLSASPETCLSEPVSRPAAAKTVPCIDVRRTAVGLAKKQPFPCKAAAVKTEHRNRARRCEHQDLVESGSHADGGDGTTRFHRKSDLVVCKRSNENFGWCRSSRWGCVLLALLALAADRSLPRLLRPAGSFQMGTMSSGKTEAPPVLNRPANSGSLLQTPAHDSDENYDTVSRHPPARDQAAIPGSHERSITSSSAAAPAPFPLSFFPALFEQGEPQAAGGLGELDEAAGDHGEVGAAQVEATITGRSSTGGTKQAAGSERQASNELSVERALPYRYHFVACARVYCFLIVSNERQISQGIRL